MRHRQRTDVSDADAIYLLTVKANQPKLYSHMIGLFEGYATSLSLIGDGGMDVTSFCGTVRN